MKRLLIICAITLSLGGCATLERVQTAVSVATTPVAVTPTMVLQIEEGLKVATSGLVGYRRLCLQKVIDPVTRNCRQVIVRLQPYTKAAAVAIVDLRVAVRQNNQITALSAYNALRGLIANIQTERQLAGVQ